MRNKTFVWQIVLHGLNSTDVLFHFHIYIKGDIVRYKIID